MSSNPVIEWFGAQFHNLDPRLQDLHRHGGQLRGTVQIDFGRGLAGWVGRRVARRLGIPPLRQSCGMQVDIAHTPHALLWARTFEGGSRMDSEFEPQGHWPDGVWIERSGPLQLHLGVDIIDGGWYWRLRAARLGIFRVPRALLPASRASKRMVNSRYCFLVDFSIPLLGRVLRYQGELELVASAAAGGAEAVVSS